jgi:large subunit ribosomal protein L10
MKKLGIIVKEATEKIITQSAKEAEAVFIVKYSGLSSFAMSNLRRSLKESHSRMFVVKNTVARRALKGMGLDGVIKSIDGPCGLVFGKDEPVSTSKALYAFFKDNNKLVLEGGFIKDNVLSQKDVEALAKLPGRDQLRAQLVGGLMSPISGLVFVLNANLRTFVYCLDQVKQKKAAAGGQ